MTVVDDTNNDDKGNEEELREVPTLGEITEVAKRAFDEQDEAEENEDAEDNEEDDEDTGGDDDSDGEDSDDSDDDSDDDEEDEEDEEEEPEPEPVKKELNTDITQAGDDKVSIQDADGKTFYFNNVNEIPDDFEPKSYKDLARVSSEFAKRDWKAEQEAERNQEAESKRKADQEVKDLNKSWTADIKELTKLGELPKDEKEREKEVGEVFAYMTKRLNDGKPIDNFEDAYYRVKQQKESAERKKQQNDTKKKNASKVFGSSGGGATKSSKSGGGLREGLPLGTTLDMVHEKYSRQT